MNPPTAQIFDLGSNTWLAFLQSATVLRADALTDVLPALEEADRLVSEQGLWAAGFLAYEAAPAFDPAFSTHPKSDLPLLWLGLFPPPQTCLPPDGELPDLAWKPSQERGAYHRAIAAIKDRIARGDTYQVNYTLRLHADFNGDALTFFGALVGSRPAGPAACILSERFAVCSASPELFFALDGSRLVSRPMKGSAARGLSSAEDQANMQLLAASPKDRAENVMIVDMVRNDMGRIAQTGSVEVPRLFEIERHPTILQMTSTVTCRTAAPVPEIFNALFPCASITGAPKISTMEIIRELENGPRGVYTGAIGFWGPGRRAQFNVAIRTAVIDCETGQAEYGAGGGIVWDSDPESEYRECLLKTRLLSAPRPVFDLLETLRWNPGEGFFLLERHLDRLADSAGYFGTPCDRDRIRAALEAAVRERPGGSLKVRLLLSPDGSPRCETAALEGPPLSFDELLVPGDRPGRTGVPASFPVDRSQTTLYHKTTHREVYERATADRAGDESEVLLWNEAGEATEFTASNLVARIGGRLVTPPVASGLLPGTLRAELLARGVITEGVIRMGQLASAEKVWAINSVRGWRKVILEIG